MQRLSFALARQASSSFPPPCCFFIFPLVPPSNSKKNSKSKKVPRRNLKNALKEIIIYEQPCGIGILLHGPYDLSIPGSTSSPTWHSQSVAEHTPFMGCAHSLSPPRSLHYQPQLRETPPAQMTVRKPRLVSQKTAPPAGWSPFSQKLKPESKLQQLSQILRPLCCLRQRETLSKQ